MTRLMQTLRSELAHSAAARGVALALLTATISGFAIFTNSYAVKEFSSPTLFTTLKNSMVGLALLAVVLRPGPMAEIRRLSPRHAAGLALLGVIGGSVPFILFFEGLSRVDAGNAAFLQKTLFVWVALLAVVTLRERIGLAQIGALGVLLVAQLMLGGPGRLRGDGVLMVFAATLLWAVEVVVAKRLLGSVSSEVAASARMTLGAVLLIAYLAATGGIGAVAHLSTVQVAWVLGTGAILLAYVGAWYHALRLAPATAVTCVLVIGAPITAGLDIVAGRGVPATEDLLAYGIILLAAGSFAAVSLVTARGAQALEASPA
jgi:drug/metabolite transporter (DMT)-like permease